MGDPDGVGADRASAPASPLVWSAVPLSAHGLRLCGYPGYAQPVSGPGATGRLSPSWTLWTRCWLHRAAGASLSGLCGAPAASTAAGRLCSAAPSYAAHRSDADFLRRTSGPSCLHSFALDLRKLGRNLLGKGIDPPADKAQKISAIEIAHKLWIGRAERFGRYEVRHPCPVWIKVGTTLHRTGILVRFKAGHTMVRHAIRPAIAPTSSPPCRIGDEIRSCTSSSGVRVYSSEIRYRRPQGRETKC